MALWKTSIASRAMRVDGSASLNVAVHTDAFDIKTNFNVYDIDLKGGTSRVTREGLKDQFGEVWKESLGIRYPGRGALKKGGVDRLSALLVRGTRRCLPRFLRKHIVADSIDAFVHSLGGGFRPRIGKGDSEGIGHLLPLHFLSTRGERLDPLGLPATKALSVHSNIKLSASATAT